MPHFLTLYEKSVPMVVVWVGGEDPVVSLRSRYRHRGFRVGSNIHAGMQEAKQNMRVRRNWAWQVKRGPQWVYFGKISITVLFSIIYSISPGIHKNIFSANLHSVAIHPHRRILPDLAGGHVVLPPMPGAGDDLPIHDPLAQWAPPVQAGVVDGIELATDIG